MSDGYLLALQTTGFLLGMLSMCAGLFLYEDETGKIQSRLEDLWIRIDDQSKDKLAKHKKFFRELTMMTNGLMDRLFGEEEEPNKATQKRTKAVRKAKAHRHGDPHSKPLPFKRYSSWKVSNTVTGLWVVSLGVLLFFVRDSETFLFAYYTQSGFRLLIYTYLFIVCAFVLRPFFLYIPIILFRAVRPRVAIWYVFAGVVIFVIVIAPYLIEYRVYRNYQLSFTTQLKVLAGIHLGGVASVFGYWMFIFWSRLSILAQDESVLTTLFESIMLVVFFVPLPVMFLVVLTVSSPLEAGSFLDGGIQATAAFVIAGANLYLAVLSLTFFFLAFTMVVHRLFWPAVSRPVYALQRLGVAKRHKLLTLLGAGLAVTSLGIDTTWLKKLLIDVVNSAF